MIKIQKSRLSHSVKAHDSQVHDCPDTQAIPDHPHNALIIGRRGAGKSTVMVSLLNTDMKKGGLRKRFKTIYAVSPTMEHDGKYKRLYDEISEEGNHYTEPTEEVFSEILDKIKEMRKEHPKEQSLLILDDVVDKLKGSHSQSLLNHLIIAGRHYGLCIYTLSQKLNSISTIARNNAEVWILFNIANRKEYETFINEMNYDPKKLDEIYQTAMDGGGSNNFLTINSSNCRMRFFRRFDPMCITSDIVGAPTGTEAESETD